MFQMQTLKGNHFDSSILEQTGRKSSSLNEKKRKLNAQEEVKKKPKAERKRKSSNKEESSQILLPHILQPILQEVFDEFWNLELEPEVAIPFFTTITRENCAHLGMPDFYEKISIECTFADMKVSMCLQFQSLC
jgi:hypothetical protein